MKKYTDVFVKYDINGNALFVGDKVRVTRGRINYNPYGDDDYYASKAVDIPEETWEGEIALLLSRGINIRVNNGYIKPNLTNKGYVKWTWEKL